MLNDWVINNYDKMMEVCKKYNIGINTDELFQSCVEQFLTNKKTKDIDDSQKLFFFTKIVMNNAASKSSKFYRENRSFKTEQLFPKEIMEIEYQEFDELNWVYSQIEEDKKTIDWYYARLFEIYIEQGASIINTSKKTTIPRNSVSRDINKYRKKLILRRKNRIDLE